MRGRPVGRTAEGRIAYRMLKRRLHALLGKERFLRLAIWSLAGLGGYVLARFVVNIFVARMLTPSDVGVMVLITSIRLGFELLSDIGIEQNIVKNVAGGEDHFLSTAWAMQMGRGAILCAGFLALAPYLAGLFQIDVNYLFAMSLAPLLTSLHSPAIFLLVKDLKVKERSLFELKADLFSTFLTILFIYLYPSIWSLITAQLLGIAFRSALSYTLPRAGLRRHFSPTHALEIMRFGRWITLSSAALFLASHVDKVLLGAIAPLATLGLYGLARALAEVPVLVARRLSYQVVFPSLSKSLEQGDTADLRSFARLRYRFVLLIATCAGAALPLADIAVRIIYGERYLGAAPVLSVLIVSSWIAIASNLNEARMLSAGKPVYESIANGLKLAMLAVGCPWAYSVHGIVGAAAIVAASEFGRYLIVAVGLKRTEAPFLRQDLVATYAGCLAAFAVWACRTALAA